MHLELAKLHCNNNRNLLFLTTNLFQMPNACDNLIMLLIDNNKRLILYNCDDNSRGLFVLNRPKKPNFFSKIRRSYFNY